MEKKGFVVISDLVASDRDSNPQLKLLIDWNRTEFIKDGIRIKLIEPEKQVSLNLLCFKMNFSLKFFIQVILKCFKCIWK